MTKKYIPKQDLSKNVESQTRYRRRRSIRVLVGSTFGAASDVRVYTKDERDAWAKENGYL